MQIAGTFRESKNYVHQLTIFAKEVRLSSISSFFVAFHQPGVVIQVSQKCWQVQLLNSLKFPWDRFQAIRLSDSLLRAASGDSGSNAPIQHRKLPKCAATKAKGISSVSDKHFTPRVQRFKASRRYTKVGFH